MQQWSRKADQVVFVHVYKGRGQTNVLRDKNFIQFSLSPPGLWRISPYQESNKGEAEELSRGCWPKGWGADKSPLISQQQLSGERLHRGEENGSSRSREKWMGRTKKRASRQNRQRTKRDIRKSKLECRKDKGNAGGGVYPS